MSKELNIKIEKAIHFLTEHFAVPDKSSRKPVLFHDIRVAVYLYKHGYSEDIVLAGLLHDAIEWSDITEEMLRDKFGGNVVKLVLASTKNDAIVDKQEKINELIQRCVSNGQDALIVKTADIMDSFEWYASQENEGELKYCMRNANAIFKFKPDNFEDEIFKELKEWQKKFAYLSE